MHVNFRFESVDPKLPRTSAIYMTPIPRTLKRLRKCFKKQNGLAARRSAAKFAPDKLELIHSLRQSPCATEYNNTNKPTSTASPSRTQEPTNCPSQPLIWSSNRLNMLNISAFGSTSSLRSTPTAKDLSGREGEGQP
ncbi:hypothetical protein N7466_003544 [Penicillium verhagenii]|uniref:uncharacterized protein n=1 Tax=Penicillium verhagenii TaxID=1562060 RepID=UPI0025459EB9|nr:uncharacterized protein N7466_003544 [Penicillium verhagenii]KAJ5937094.1 hypothetical protein N7466_003544 [Penicillium verhagenii]